MKVLGVENLKVSTDGKIVVNGVSLHVNPGETVLLFGPNGSGKTSLAMAILGHPNYRIIGGRIYFYDRDVTEFPIEKRVSLGITAAFQFSPELKGIKLMELAREIAEKHGVSEDTLKELIEILQVSHLLNRHTNVGFSGGERKRVEILLTTLQAPKFVVFDEPDSGVDRDSILIISKAIEKMFELGLKGALIITHTGFLAKHLKANRAYVMLDHRIVCEGPAEIISDHIAKYGFDMCILKRQAGYYELA
ncbi:MAG: ATP-binding cassette domain-containing protein [Crenarchaeota archaeon]|nr:ATP-binding cassette domain-containing protein [Thermoproteota archaeon]